MSITYTRIRPESNFYEITIVGDVNDGDYVTTINQYNEEEFMELLPYLRALLSNFMGSNIQQLEWCDTFEEGNTCTCDTGDEYDKWHYDNCKIRLRPRKINDIETAYIPEFLELPQDDQCYRCHSIESVSIRWFTTEGYAYIVEVD